MPIAFILNSSYFIHIMDNTAVDSDLKKSLFVLFGINAQVPKERIWKVSKRCVIFSLKIYR